MVKPAPTAATPDTRLGPCAASRARLSRKETLVGISIPQIVQAIKKPAGKQALRLRTFPSNILSSQRWVSNCCVKIKRTRRSCSSMEKHQHRASWNDPLFLLSQTHPERQYFSSMGSRLYWGWLWLSSVNFCSSFWTISDFVCTALGRAPLPGINHMRTVSASADVGGSQLMAPSLSRSPQNSR